jgi:hypothetical protein
MDQNNNESKFEFNFNHSSFYQQCPPTPRLSDFNYYQIETPHMNLNESSHSSSPKTPASKEEYQDSATPKLDEKVRKSIHSLELIMESMNKSNLSKQLDEIDEDFRSNKTLNDEFDPFHAYKTIAHPVFKEIFEKEIVWNKKC